NDSSNESLSEPMAHPISHCKSLQFPTFRLNEPYDKLLEGVMTHPIEPLFVAQKLFKIILVTMGGNNEPWYLLMGHSVHPLREDKKVEFGVLR
ncbi:hypothetical protein HAX54_002182, partial [Datura stramonium]|nr:hypothetical protein [Datura stramonium]